MLFKVRYSTIGNRNAIQFKQEELRLSDIVFGLLLLYRKKSHSLSFQDKSFGGALLLQWAAIRNLAAAINIKALVFL